MAAAPVIPGRQGDRRKAPPPNIDDDPVVIKDETFVARIKELEKSPQYVPVNRVDHEVVVVNGAITSSKKKEAVAQAVASLAPLYTDVFDGEPMQRKFAGMNRERDDVYAYLRYDGVNHTNATLLNAHLNTLVEVRHDATGLAYLVTRQFLRDGTVLGFYGGEVTTIAEYKRAHQSNECHVNGALPTCESSVLPVAKILNERIKQSRATYKDAVVGADGGLVIIGKHGGNVLRYLHAPRFVEVPDPTTNKIRKMKEKPNVIGYHVFWGGLPRVVFVVSRGKANISDGNQNETLVCQRIFENGRIANEQNSHSWVAKFLARAAAAAAPAAALEPPSDEEIESSSDSSSSSSSSSSRPNSRSSVEDKGRAAGPPPVNRVPVEDKGRAAVPVNRSPSVSRSSVEDKGRATMPVNRSPSVGRSSSSSSVSVEEKRRGASPPASGKSQSPSRVPSVEEKARASPARPVVKKNAVIDLVDDSSSSETPAKKKPIRIDLVSDSDDSDVVIIESSSSSDSGDDYTEGRAASRTRAPKKKSVAGARIAAAQDSSDDEPSAVAASQILNAVPTGFSVTRVLSHTIEPIRDVEYRVVVNVEVESTGKKPRLTNIVRIALNADKPFDMVRCFRRGHPSQMGVLTSDGNGIISAYLKRKSSELPNADRPGFTTEDEVDTFRRNIFFDYAPLRELSMFMGVTSGGDVVVVDRNGGLHDFFDALTDNAQRLESRSMLLNALFYHQERLRDLEKKKTEKS